MSILKLVDKYPQLGSQNLTDLNIRVFESMSTTNSDLEILKYCFAINFYSKKYVDVECFDKNDKVILDLQKMINNEEVQDPNQISLDIYLRYIRCLLDEGREISQAKSQYAINYLEKIPDEQLKCNIIDHLFKIGRSKEYNKIADLLLLKGIHISSFFKAQNNLMLSLNKTLAKYNVKYEIESRIKTLYSLNEKIKSKNISVEQINDLLGLRIYLQNEDSCFEAMKILIKEYNVVKERFKDYISYPKENGYQSLHLILDYNKVLIEIQIRSYEMHKICQTGSASHISYKRRRSQI